MRRPTAPRRRIGFTLIELLVVIVILALLIGLLLPAVMNAVGRANEARVAAEIQALSQALAAFKSAHGDYPPSRIVISENGDYSAGTLGPLAPLATRSVNYLRKFWPRINISTTGPTVAGTNPPVPSILDANGNGNLDAPYILTGQECLVFFLGGVPQNTGGVWSVTGFSRNPTNPFQSSLVANNRTVPDFEFPSSRLIPNLMNITAKPNQVPPAVFPGFCDPLGNDPNQDGLMPFYCYFSSYAGSGYDPNDCDGGNATEADPSGSSPSVNCAFMAPGSAIVPPPTTAPTNNIISSTAPNPYTNTAPVPTQADGSLQTSGLLRPRAWQNANTFQIISAGRDRYFGMGGQYLSNRIASVGDIKLPFIDARRPGANYVADSAQTMQANAQVTGATVSEEARVREKDNLTNFSPGRLD